jgi:tRNA threonylcarbamoyladenosine biosynthesis protein TsaE
VSARDYRSATIFSQLGRKYKKEVAIVYEAGASQGTTAYTLKLHSRQAEQTQDVGRRLGELLRGDELILLDGQLGAGKTTFTQGLAQGMQIHDLISSPTFTILKEYHRRRKQALPARKQTAFPLFHFDLYRLDDPDEIMALGFDEYFEGEGVCVVEWPERAADFWPEAKLVVSLRIDGEDQRSLTLHASGEHYCQLLHALEQKH